MKSGVSCSMFGLMSLVAKLSRSVWIVFAVTIASSLSAQTLLLHFDFSGNLNDSSGNGNNGTNNGGAFVNDRFGNPSSAIELEDNATDYFSASSSVVNGLTDFTFAFFADMNELNSNNNLISGATSLNANSFLIGYAPSSNRWEIQIGGVSNSISDSTLEDNAWHHVAFTRSGSTLALYIDGIFVNSTSVSSTALAVDTGGFLVGQDQDTLGGGFQVNQGWGGSIDDFRIYNGALSAGQIGTLAAVPEPSHFATLLGGLILAGVVFLRRRSGRISG